MKSRRSEERAFFEDHVREHGAVVSESFQMARARIEIRGIVPRRSVRLNENHASFVSRKPTHALKHEVFSNRGSHGPNQSSEPTRPAVRFLTFEMNAKVTSCSGLVAHL